MAEHRPKPERPWREVAEQVTKCDSDKVVGLCLELLDALGKKNQAQHTPFGDEEPRRYSA